MADEHDSWLNDAFGLDVSGTVDRIREEASGVVQQATDVITGIAEQAADNVPQIIAGVQNVVGGPVTAVVGAAVAAAGAAGKAIGGLVGDESTGPFRLTGSVGRGGKNNLVDVRAVQAALGVGVDGQCGAQTIAAIEAFQRDTMGMSKPDGRVDTGGATERALSGGAGKGAPPQTPGGEDEGGLLGALQAGAQAVAGAGFAAATGVVGTATALATGVVGAAGSALSGDGAPDGLLSAASEAISDAVSAAGDAASGVAAAGAWLVDPELGPFAPLVQLLSGVSPNIRGSALDSALLLHAGGGDDGLRAAVGLPLAQITAPTASCVASTCPDPAEEEPAVYPVWKQAELCIQGKYKESHRGNTIGVNKDWLTLVGRDPAERQALECLRRDFTAKSGMNPGEPDLWDFSSRTMYEITTRSGASFRKGKLTAEIALANSLTGREECGGTLYSPGDWVPPGPCLFIGDGLWAQVVNEGGVLIYTALRQGGKKKPVLDPVLLPLIILILKFLESLKPALAPKPTLTPRPVSPILIPTKLLKCLLAPDIGDCMSGRDLA